jgi:hypothetical protein
MAIDPGERRRIWLALVIAALAVIAFQGRRLLRESDAAQNAPDVAAVASLVPLMAQNPVGRAPSRLLRGVDPTGVVRDPFRDGFRAVEATPRIVAANTPAVREPTDRERVWVVSAILISESRRAAVINDVLVNVGGELPGGGGRLTAVENNRVIVTDPKGVRRTININSGTQ